MHHRVNTGTREETFPMSESLLERRQTRRKLTVETLTEIGESLADVDWRLLHWLLRYPLQRADDLIVGVARWASRATVYRHVQALEANGLVESVLPKTPGTGKRIYYLSNPGLHLLARHLDRPARELAQSWQADESGLLHLLPRLPTLLVLQEVVNGLVTHAADAMTTQGRRPRLVRWNWQRDVTHRFLYREKRMRFFADGAVALCIRTRLSESGVLDQWYGVLFLSTGLDDERLMRLRLERLMYWRESPERWSCYQHMLPVLILARAPRQRDHWQHAVETTTRKLRLEPLVGALACLPPDEKGHPNPWFLNWRTLSTETTCHLQEVLNPLPRETFPPTLQLLEGEQENQKSPSHSNAEVDTVSPGISARLRCLVVGGLAKRANQVTQGGLEEQAMVSLLGLRLTPCHWSMLRLLLDHPLLSDEELAALLGLERKSVRCSLYELHQLACLEQVGTSAGNRWHLCERGLRQIAASQHMHIRVIAEVPDDPISKQAPPIRQRGEAWFLQHIQHTAGMYSFFASVAQAVRKEPEHELCWWETGAMCERRYSIGEQWYNLRPDALAEYRVGQQQMRFWLEWDRGTMNVRDLAVKFASYSQYIASREWAHEHTMPPRLLCVTPDLAQERRIRRVIQAQLAYLSGFEVLTTTEVLLNESGPLTPVWLQGVPKGSLPAQSRVTLSQHWHEGIFGK